MSNNRWKRHSNEEVAVDELLDAAGRTFAEIGVSRATMVDVARAAGCSRATLYRYFPNQEALHFAFVHRATLRIAERLADERTAVASTSLVDRILAGIAAVRSDPLLLVWFEPENLSVPMTVSKNSELLQAMSTGLIGQLDAVQHNREELELRGAWLLRSIVSLLAMPGVDAATERAMVESCLVPVLVAEVPQVEARS